MTGRRRVANIVGSVIWPILRELEHVPTALLKVTGWGSSWAHFKASREITGLGRVANFSTLSQGYQHNQPLQLKFVGPNLSRLWLAEPACRERHFLLVVDILCLFLSIRVRPVIPKVGSPWPLRMLVYEDYLTDDQCSSVESSEAFGRFPQIGDRGISRWRGLPRDSGLRSCSKRKKPIVAFAFSERPMMY
jgi:hypothetical protein